MKTRRGLAPAATLFLVLSLVLIAFVVRTTVRGRVANSTPSWAADLINHLGNSDRELVRDGEWQIVIADPNCSNCRQFLIKHSGSGREQPFRTFVILTKISGGNDVDAATLVDRDVPVRVIEDVPVPCVPAVLALSNGAIKGFQCEEADRIL